MQPEQPKQPENVAEGYSKVEYLENEFLKISHFFPNTGDEDMSELYSSDDPLQLPSIVG